MRTLAVLVVAAAAIVVFLIGVSVGAAGFIGLRVPVTVGSGMVGDHVVTLWADGDNRTAYGARNSIPWRDGQGLEHEDGWPDCLAASSEVEGIPFRGAMVWYGDFGRGTILWVDCTGR